MRLPGAPRAPRHRAEWQPHHSPPARRYGIFPCSESLFGSIILMGMYGNLLLVGANLIGDGSELLLEIMDPGLIGGLVLPILGALPDAAMIVVSGMGGTVQAAQEQVAVGVGTLAGSTVMLLSIAWGGSLILGRCDIVQGRAKDKTLTKGWQPGARLTLRWLEATLTQTGVSTDKATRINAYIMIATGLLYLIPQIPTFCGFEHDPMAALGGAIACGLALAAYCAYQVVAPELQKRKMAHARKQLAVRSTLRMAHGIAATAGSVLVDERGVIRDVALQAVFERFDEDKSGTIDRQELRKMAKVFLASSANMSAAHMESNIEEFMRGMDADGDGQITFEEMKQGLQRWLHDLKMEQDAAKQRRGGGGRASDDESLLLLDDQQHLIAAAGFVDEDDDDDEQESEAEGAMTPEEITRTAAFKLLAGAAIVAFVADPMVCADASCTRAHTQTHSCDGIGGQPRGALRISAGRYMHACMLTRTPIIVHTCRHVTHVQTCAGLRPRTHTGGCCGCVQLGIEYSRIFCVVCRHSFCEQRLRARQQSRLRQGQKDQKHLPHFLPGLRCRGNEQHHVSRPLSSGSLCARLGVGFFGRSRDDHVEHPGARPNCDIGGDLHAVLGSGLTGLVSPGLGASRVP